MIDTSNDKQVIVINSIHEKVEQEAHQLQELLQEADDLKTDIKMLSDDPLAAKKFRTKSGLPSIRLEKLVLELDGLELSDRPPLRQVRKELVKRINDLYEVCDKLDEKAKQLIAWQENLPTVLHESGALVPNGSEQEFASGQTESKEAEMETEDVKETEVDLHTAPTTSEEIDFDMGKEDKEEKEEQEIPPVQTTAKDDTVQLEPRVSVHEDEHAVYLTFVGPNASELSVSLKRNGQVKLAHPQSPETSWSFQVSMGDVDVNRSWSRPLGRDELRVVVPKLRLNNRFKESLTRSRFMPKEHQQQRSMLRHPDFHFWSAF